MMQVTEQWKNEQQFTQKVIEIAHQHMKFSEASFSILHL
jgi:hypothetical protein